MDENKEDRVVKVLESINGQFQKEAEHWEELRSRHAELIEASRRLGFHRAVFVLCTIAVVVLVVTTVWNGAFEKNLETLRVQTEKIEELNQRVEHIVDRLDSANLADTPPDEKHRP